MSRVGKKPVIVPKAVKVALNGRVISFEGAKGKLSYEHLPVVKVSVTQEAAGTTVLVERNGEEKLARAMHGTTRAIIVNNIKGVSEGYVRELEIQGVGYKAELSGKIVTLSVGFANQIKLPVPDGVAVKIEGQGTRINLQGADKQVVGQFAAEIRRVRKPEPYKGKGIRYVGEVVKRKAGKQFAGAGAK